MTQLVVGLAIGLLLPPAWRLVRELRDARRGDYVDVTKERLAMLVKSGAL